MEQIIMMVMAVGALLGGVDRMLGNRMGLGDRFEEGFRLLGPVALAQAGIICVAPVLANVLGPAVSGIYHAMGQDPAMFGSILAIDMGGYQLSALLADDPLTGGFAGIVAASMLGCTASFTIPVGMGFLDRERQDAFARGMLCGLVALPAALLVGALLCGLPFVRAVWVCLPVVVLSGALGLGLVKVPGAMLRGFRVFAAGIRILTTIGLTLGAVQYMTGWVLLPGLAPLEEAMQVVCSIGMVMLGSLPMAELVQRLLRKPMAKLARLLGLTERGTVNMLVCYVSSTPALAALKDMEQQDVTVNAAFAVCAASCLSAHLGFALATERALALPMAGAKLLGGVLGAALAVGLSLHMTRKSP
ncbi:MAG: ethanolamine utilization protein EutH [Aristaeellaceae bacterium]